MGVVNKERFLAGPQPVQRPVEALGGDVVFLRPLTVAERLALSNKFAGLTKDAKAEDHTRVMLIMIARSVCEEGGARMWTDEQDDEAVAVLLGQPNAVTDELAELCLELNRMGKYEKAALKEAVGNSGEIPS